MATAGEAILNAGASTQDQATLGPRIEPFADPLQDSNEARDPASLREDGSEAAHANASQTSEDKPHVSSGARAAGAERPGSDGCSSSTERNESLLSDPLQIPAFSQGEPPPVRKGADSSAKDASEDPEASTESSPRQVDDPLLSTARGSGSTNDGPALNQTRESSVATSPPAQHEGSGYLEQDAELYQDYLDMVMVADMEDVLLHEDEEPGGRQGPRPGRSPWPAQRSTPPAANRGGSLHGQASWGGLQTNGTGHLEHTGQPQGLSVVEAEVVAFRLVPGQVALGDRLVGVRAHAEYNVRVTGSDGSVWMVQRRYREFMDLHWELVRFLECTQPQQGQGIGGRAGQQVPGTLLLPREWSEAWKEGGQLVGTSSTRTVERRRQLLHSCLAATLAAGPPLATAPALVRFLVEDPMVLSQATGDLVRPQQGGAAPANALSAGVSAGALGLGASLGRLQHWLQGPAALLQSPAAPLDSGVGFGPGAAPTTAKQKDVDLDAPVGAWGPGMANGVGAAQPGHDTSAPLPGAEEPLGVPAPHQRMHLVLQLHPLLFPDARLMLRQLSTQRYACASCFRPLEEPAPEQNLRAPLGLQAALRPFQPLQPLQSEASPRLCHYLGRLFCGACQGGDNAVLPALVLHRWDFGRRPVCQHSHAYLESIADQPILCVAAVNPLLFQRCPALGHLNALRSQVALVFRALPSECPVRAKSRQALGRRDYVLDAGSEGFYAMRELEDISKGPFALFPDLLRQLLRRLRSHIEGGLCGPCQRAGVDLCAAGTHCADNSCALITRDQGEGAPPVRCPSCHAAYHPRCLPRLQRCAKCRSRALVGDQGAQPSTPGARNGEGAAGEGGEDEELDDSPGSGGRKSRGPARRGATGSHSGGSARRSGSWFGSWGATDSTVLQMQPF